MTRQARRMGRLVPTVSDGSEPQELFGEPM